MDIGKLKNELLENEEVLMGKILDYAKKHDYTKYTSTLKWVRTMTTPTAK